MNNPGYPDLFINYADTNIYFHRYLLVMLISPHTNITELLINKIPHEKNLLEKSLSLLKKEMTNRFQG
jgi:hypothetical protein